MHQLVAMSSFNNLDDVWAARKGVKVKIGQGAFLVFLSLSSIPSLTASAAGAQSGIVTSMYFTSGNVGGSTDSLVYFFVSGTRTGTPPTCATAGYWMIRDAKSTIGQEQIAALLTAKSTGQTVSVNGTGLCARWPDGEDVQNIIQ